jgi:outer membrane protein OmpA-like peptidoglycan-associated protein
VRRSSRPPTRWLTGLLGLSAVAWAEPPPIHLVEGMVLTEVVSYHANSPDYVRSLQHIGPDGLRWRVESEISTADKARRVSGYGKAGFDSADDLKSSHRVFLRFFDDETDPQVGATRGMASSEVFDELHSKGETSIDVIEIPPEQGDVYDPDLVYTRKNFRGTLTRVGVETLRVLVNGTPTQLPVLHAKGSLKARELVHEFEFWWLDDSAARLMMHYRFGNYTERRVVRIDYPVEHGSGVARLTTSLTKQCHAELSGVYFASGSADLLTASRPALDSIATVMKQHADWILTIEGHTDNVGSDETNEVLSRYRAAAVKTELIEHYAIESVRLKTEGFGRKRPIDSNDTVDGRAHNRRVEVARAC